MTQAFETAFHALLIGNATLAALVGDRIWPEFVPRQTDAEFPCIQSVLGYNAEFDLMGTLVLNADIVFEVFANDKAETLDINGALYTLLNNYTGTLGGIAVRSTWFSSFEPGTSQKSPGQSIFAAFVRYSAILDIG